MLIEYIGHHHVANVFETAEQIRKGHDMFITAQSRMTMPNAALFVHILMYMVTHMGSIQKFIINSSVVLITHGIVEPNTTQLQDLHEGH